MCDDDSEDAQDTIDRLVIIYKRCLFVKSKVISTSYNLHNIHLSKVKRTRLSIDHLEDDKIPEYFRFRCKEKKPHHNNLTQRAYALALCMESHRNFNRIHRKNTRKDANRNT